MKQRYYAKEVNGLGYIFDNNFSEKVPIAVEKTIDFALKQVEKFNAEEDCDCEEDDGRGADEFWLVMNDCMRG